jgi:hypothetical protein
MPVRRNRKPTNRNVQHFVPCTNEQVLIRNINDTWDPEKKTVIIDDLDEQYIKYFVFDKIEENIVLQCIYLTNNIFLFGIDNTEQFRILIQNHQYLNEIIRVNKNEL